MERARLEDLGRSCVSQGDARHGDTSQARHRPLFPLPQPLNRVFTSIFLPLIPDSEYRRTKDMAAAASCYRHMPTQPAAPVS